VHVISTQKSCQLAAKESDRATFIDTGIRTSSIGNGFIGKLLGNFILSIRLSVVTMKSVKRNDIVFSGTNPSLLVVMLALIKPISKFRWILLVYDVFPENLVPAKLVSQNSYMYKITRWIFDILYKRADKIIVIGRDMQEVVCKKTSGMVPIKYIPNWIDPLDIHSLERDNLALNYDKDSEEKVVFQFFGNMGIVQGLDILLEAISKTKCLNAKFKFIGGGSGFPLVEEYIMNNPQLDVELIPPISFNENMTALKECDVALVTLAPGMKGLAVPSKAFFSLTAEKPILVVGEQNAELDLLIKEYPKIGWFCDVSDSSLIAKKIDEIANLDFSNLKGFSWNVIKSHCSYKIASARYVSLIKDMLDED